MKVADYERAVIAGILLNPSELLNPIAAELSEDKFGYGPGHERADSHKLIYQGILDLKINKKPIDLANLEKQLGDTLEMAGGSVYLRSILDVPEKLRLSINRPAVFSWAQVVDDAGRLRHLGMVIDTYHQKYQDFENLVSTVSDVDAFMSDVVGDIQKAQGLLRHEYRPFREGVEEFRRHLAHNIVGEVTQILPMGWPALFQMGIPPKQGLMVISGLEGSGKTQLLLQILLGRVQPGCVAFNSYEMPGWKLAKRLACCLAGVDGHQLALGQYEEDSDEVRRVQEALEFLETLPIYYDDSQMMTSDAIHWQSNALHANCGPLTDLGIDYAELVPDKAETEELRVSRIYKNAARLVAIGATSYMVSQLNRGAQMTTSKLGGKGRLRYTGVAQHVSHAIGELYNIPAMLAAGEEFSIPDEYDKDKAYFILEKNRDGPTGAIPLTWDGPCTRFADDSLSKKFGPSSLYENLDRVRSMTVGDF